ncbi:MAG: hypothetical protein PHG06_12555 [Parabacteroides sp.]|nr:hypothetical protein [Parabacteroides sp.]
MRWILSAGKDIAVDVNQIQARRDYIQRVTNTDVSTWKSIQVNGKDFYFCVSNDEVNGTLITAHINDVGMLCSLRDICASKLVVANTCIWQKGADKEILKYMRFVNKDVELWFAEQELFLDSSQTFRQTAELNNIGLFGFQTSLSERNLFKNRNKGLVKAIHESFLRVSPVILED